MFVEKIKEPRLFVEDLKRRFVKVFLYFSGSCKSFMPQHSMEHNGLFRVVQRSDI